MRLFVYEYASAVGPGVPASIRTEGWAMLSALVDDFVHVPDVEVTTLLHEDITASLGHHCFRVSADQEEATFRKQAQRADYTLVIAPETGGILAQRSRLVLEAGGTLLGSSPEAIEQTTDKLQLSGHLLRQDIPTPKSAICNRQSAISTESFPAVVKPRDGAGSQATFLIRSAAELPPCLEKAQGELPGTEFIMQAFVPGLAASVAVLVGPSSAVPLMPCLQHLSADGRFRYLGGKLPLRPELARRASELGCRTVRAVPGLLGYVGVDLVLGTAADGDQVIEINPRLTTSYIGLRRLARFNIADLLLRVVAGNCVNELTWSEETIRFGISE